MPETSKEVGRRWFEEVWNKKRREAIAEMLGPDSVLHEGPGDARGPEAFYPFFDSMNAAFSDIHVTVDDEIAEDDKVCIRWSCTMRHTAPWFGIPPTNKQVQVTGISIARTGDGKFLESWQNWDMLGLMQQLKSEQPAPTYVAALAANVG